MSVCLSLWRIPSTCRLDDSERSLAFTANSVDILEWNLLKFFRCSMILRCTSGIFHNKIHLISRGCPWPSVALQVQNCGLKHQSFIHWYSEYYWSLFVNWIIIFTFADSICNRINIYYNHIYTCIVKYNVRNNLIKVSRVILHREDLSNISEYPRCVH